MTDIRRYFIPNAAFFVTAVCHERHPHLAPPERRELLLQVLREVKVRFPFRMLGYAVMPDHFHLLLLPARADELPRILQAVKLRFVRRLRDDVPAKIWQRRYWDHVIRDRNDLERHLDYIHYNSVKHGLASEPGKHPWSSFRHYLARGSYPRDWGTVVPPTSIEGLHSE